VNVNMLWAPSVALYVRLLLEEHVQFHYRQWPHLLPYLFSLTMDVLFCSQPLEIRQQLCLDVFNGNFPPVLLFLNVILLLQSLGYLTYCVRKVWAYTRATLPNTIPNEKLKWAKEFVYILLFLNIIAIVMSLVLPQHEVIYNYVPLLYMSVYYLIIYKAIRYSHSPTFADTSFQLQFVKEEPAPYRNSTVSEAVLQELETRLRQHMKTNKPYLNPTLTIQELADQIDTSLHKLSQVLNQKMGCNFTDYVNRYRVEESKKLLRNPKSMYAIDGIGFECGFNSKTTFYKAFKKQTGLTPAAFKQEKAV